MWVALKRASCCVFAFGGYVNCACVAQLFQQLINTMLCPAFVRKFVCRSLCCVPCLNTNFISNFLSKVYPRRWILCCNCCLLTNTAMTSAVTNFWCHKLITIVNKYKNSDTKNFICSRYGKRLHILNTKISKFVSIFIHICWISAKIDFFMSQCSL